MRNSISAILPLIIVSLTGYAILPFSIRKLFLATPLKSPLLAGSPPENRQTRIPFSMPAISSAKDLSPPFRAMQPLLLAGAKIYSVPKILEPWREEGAMFSTSDLHWYVKTAWRVSNAFLEDLGYAPTDFYDYEYYLRDSLRSGPYTPEQLQSMTVERENLMVPQILSPTRASIVTHLTEKKPAALYDFEHHGYTMYLGGAKGPYRLFETGFHTGRRALIISDSYAFAMAYYLFPYYDAVLQTDLRNANYSVDLVGASIRDYMEQYEIDDVYIITCQWTSFNGPVFSWRLERFLDSAAAN